MTTTDELAATIRLDLTRIDDYLGWAYHDAYWPTNARPEPRRRRRNEPRHPLDPSNPTPPPPRHPDTIPGPVDDIGIGSYLARGGWHAAIDHLRHADTYLALALTGRPQPACPDRPHTLHQAHQLTRRTRQRLTRILADPPISARLRLQQAAHETGQAWKALMAAIDRGDSDPATHATGEPTCWNCLIRPRADKSGGRCATCYGYYRRSGKAKLERPKALDGVDEAHEAQERRRRRGEGWGQA